MVPELRQQASADVWKEMIIANWRQERPDLYLQEVGYKAANFAFLFGDGVHTEHIGLEAARWWEKKVARIVKDSLSDSLDEINNNPDCFDETKLVKPGT